MFTLLMLIMMLPFLQHQLQVVDSGKLNGAIVATPNPVFSWGKWWDGNYQQQKNGYLNDSTGFRQDFVRLNNQIDFSVFNIAHANGVVVGRDNYLYEKHYIDEYSGENYPGDSLMRIELVKLKFIQDTLEKLGKTFVFVCAPSKADYLPDYFPNELQCSGKKPTKYKAFCRLGDSIGIHRIDFNAWFVQKRATTKHLLFTKQCIHWSTYGALIAGDSLRKYIERVRQIQLPHLTISKVNYSYTVADRDMDIAEGLNLIYPVATERYSYPEYTFTSDKTTVKPKIIFLGDSFLWIFIYKSIIQNTSSDWEFWYYFNEVYKEKMAPEGLQHIDTYDWQGALTNSDVFVMLYTTSTLSMYGNGFINQAYLHFKGKPI